MMSHSRRIKRSDVTALIGSLPTDLAEKLESELSEKGISIGKINSLTPSTQQYKDLCNIYEEYISKLEQIGAIEEQSYSNGKGGIDFSNCTEEAST